MKIVIDSAIPYIDNLLDPYFDVVRKEGVKIGADDLRDADALIVRTRTRCNRALLEGSPVKFIATATIGMDHIDLDYCLSRSIQVESAAGCNAAGVLQWVAAALAAFAAKEEFEPCHKRLGIVGVGHVGSLVAEYAREWGFEVLCCDPPREERGEKGFVALEEIARRCDIVTFHTPLDSSTRHMADDEFFKMLRKGAIVLNSSRGEVVDGKALMRSGVQCALDVWEQEPNIDRELLQYAQFATPHIAGYSAQGKANASAMAVEALARRFDLPIRGWYPPQVERVMRQKISWRELCRTISSHFDIEAESRLLKSRAESFEQIRNNYCYRNEYF